MTTLEEARAAYQNKVKGFEKKQDKRRVYLGDGRGTAASNITVPANESFVYARDTLGQSDHFFPVKLNRSVRPAFNLPVWVGKRPDEPYERILDIVEEFGDYNSSASVISGVAPHNKQHSFGGGDEAFIDSQLLKEGLLRPRVPSSSVVDIMGFYHAASAGWHYFSGSSISNLLSYVPTSGSVYVTISYDPNAQTVNLTEGASFVSGNLESMLENIGTSGISGFNNVPVPPSKDIPLGAVSLDASTVKFDWNQYGGVNNTYPIRLLLNPVQSGASTFLDLNDTPSTYSLSERMYAQVNASGTAIEFDHPYKYYNKRNEFSLFAEPGQFYMLSRASDISLITTTLFGGYATRIHYGGSGTGTISVLDTRSINGQPIGSYTIDKGGTYEILASTASDISITRIQNNIRYNRQETTIAGAATLSPNEYYQVSADSSYAITLPNADRGDRAVLWVRTTANTLSVIPNSLTSASNQRINGNASYIITAGDTPHWLEFTYNDANGTGWDATKKLREDVDWRTTDTASQLEAPSDVIINGNLMVGDTASPTRALMAIGVDGATTFDRDDITAKTVLYTENNDDCNWQSVIPSGGSNSMDLQVNRDDNSLVGAFRFNDNGGSDNGYLELEGDSAFYVKVDGTTRQAIDSSGYFGVNEENPVSRMHISDQNGTVITMDDTVGGAAGTFVDLQYRKGGSLRWIFRASGASESGSNVGTDFEIRRRNDDGSDNGVAFFLKRSTGYAGINTITPSAQLDVKGSGVIFGSPTGGDKGSGTLNVATGIYLNNSAYTNPDYALEYWVDGKVEQFKDNRGARHYFRPSIRELEKFIRKNKRLPRLKPRSAMDVFERSDKMLEKVEELTTYIIEQQDQIDELKEQVATLMSG